MLSNQHFYHRIIRKMVVSFGNMFNNIKLVRYNQAGTIEIERINVPISYANKEKFYNRITEDPNLANQTLTILPRMAFEMTGLTYDPLRAISVNTELFDHQNSNTSRTVRWTPYNFDFNLSIFVRNTEDGTQIVEQILPYFSPDYTITVDYIGFDDLKLDIPIILDSVSQEADYEGLPETTRVLTWNLNFTMKGYLFGPISDISLIRKVTANTYDTIMGDGSQKLLLSNGSGNFRAGELVYQGRTLETASARAFVSAWSNTANSLYVYDTIGYFEKNKEITGVITNSKYTLNTFNFGPNQLVNLTVEPDPLSANAETDYGFTETYEEYPNIT